MKGGGRYSYVYNSGLSTILKLYKKSPKSLSSDAIWRYSSDLSNMKLLNCSSVAAICHLQNIPSSRFFSQTFSSLILSESIITPHSDLIYFTFTDHERISTSSHSSHSRSSRASEHFMQSYLIIKVLMLKWSYLMYAHWSHTYITIFTRNFLYDTSKDIWKAFESEIKQHQSTLMGTLSMQFWFLLSHRRVIWFY